MKRAEQLACKGSGGLLTQASSHAVVVALALVAGFAFAGGCIFHLDDVVELQDGGTPVGDASWDTDAAGDGPSAEGDGPSPEGDADLEAGCTVGLKRCEGNQPQQCTGAGTWTDLPACTPPTSLCENGVCVAGGPSCVGLPEKCGPAANGHCCASALVPGGSFKRSFDGVTHTDGSAPAIVSELRLDLYEVTVARFRAFVDAWPGSKPAAGAGAYAALPGSGWDAAWNTALPADIATYRAALRCEAGFETWTDTPGANETRPINCVTWYDAFAFCAWDGGRLPTEAEWNFAASGGDQQRVYPWSQPPTSQTIDATLASYFVDAQKMCFGDLTNGCSLGDLVPVGSKPGGVARWGHAEMAGNVAEWVLDWYIPAYPSPCNDCANLVATSTRVARGGGFDFPAASLLASKRFDATPGSPRFRYYGIRCARQP